MIKTVSLPYFDSNISVRGPILKGNGRRYVNFIYKDNSRERHDITYAKYILSYYFKKTLTAEETVDHYNSDPTDDSLFNLRVLEWDQHLKEDVPSSANNGYVELKCIICTSPLKRKAETTRRGKPGPFCKPCCGRYNYEVLNGIRNPLPPQEKVYSELEKPVKTKNNTITDIERAIELNKILPNALETLKNKTDEIFYKDFRHKSFLTIQRNKPKRADDPNYGIKYPHFDNDCYGVSVIIEKGRRFIYIKNKITKKRKKTSYARYLVEQQLGRYLTKDEQVDHRDHNRLNDDLSNLKVVPAEGHAFMDAKYVKDVVLNCAFCKAKMLRKPGDLNAKIRSGSKIPFCNASCFHSYSAGIKNGTVEEVPEMELVVPEYYYNEK